MARECAEDLAADGVVLAEVRFAPELHTRQDMDMEAAVWAVVEGFGQAMRDQPIVAGVVVCAIRHRPHSEELADLLIRIKTGSSPMSDLVLGFDIADNEQGFPPGLHQIAYRKLKGAGIPTTAHAGETTGLADVKEAVDILEVDRIGHGLGLAEDIASTSDTTFELGPVAQQVKDQQITLEMCPTSNLHIGAASSLAAHPVKTFYDLGLPVTINTDNRLMSRTTLSEELHRCCQAFGWDETDLNQLAANALRGSFHSDAAKELAMGGTTLLPN